MDQKHTPGPWTHNSSSVKANFLSEDEVVICELAMIPPLVGKKAPRHQQHANGRLIAAAPRLLELLEMVQPFLQAAIDDTGDEAIQMYTSMVEEQIKYVNGE